MNNNEILTGVDVNNFVRIHDLNCSIYIMTVNVSGVKKENILVRLDEGRFKDTVVSLQNFDVMKNESGNSELMFTYEIVSDPNEGKNINKKYIERVVKNIAAKLLNFLEKGIQENTTISQENKIILWI